MSAAQARQRLHEILREKSVKRGEFVLASGKTSDLYVDARQTSLHAEGARLIAELTLSQLKDDVVGIGGMTLGADPIAASVVALSSIHNRPIHGFIIRKERKGHGAGGFVVGLENLPRGSKVCMVEDTTTTGGSLLKAIERAREAGLDVVQTITVVDRQEGAAEALAAHGHVLEPLATRQELLDEAP